MLRAPLPVLLLSGLFACAAFSSAHAQTQPTATTQPAAQLKDGAFRREGKTFRLQAGQVFTLTAPVRFANGLTLRPDGIMVSKNGNRQLLENGKAINMQGDVVLYRDDMMTPEAITRHDEQTTGAAGTTTITIPVAVNLSAISAELQRTAQRFEQLQQLSQLLDQRTSAAAAGTTPPPALESQIRDLSQQLRP
ncbi:DUF6799 domain-containing protein [Hymenobacter sp. UYP22]|uniref:DUF6799 domain-containing protein n=1 Tax=Hymenobacter sp. UYP22 TaxID=3156348 RepID=UPI003390A628